MTTAVPGWIARSVEKWFDKDAHATFYERIERIIESEKLFEGLPDAVRYGETLRHILENISVRIGPEEALVGSVQEIVPSEGQRERAEELSRRWWDVPLEKIQEKALWFYSYGWLKRRPPFFLSFGHLALDWEGILAGGIGAFESKARETAGRPEIKADARWGSFLDGVLVCLHAISAFILRHASAARAEGARCGDPRRARQLDAIADSCAWISSKPPRTFVEALQLIWFLTLVLQKVCGCGVLNFSRMDQYLLPLYTRDLQTGVLAEDGTRQLLIEFFHKNNDIMNPTDHMSQEIEPTQSQLEVTYDDPNYITLGGLLKGDVPGVNELTHRFVEATAALRLRNPFLVLRYYPGIEPHLWRKAVRAMRENATLIVYNDATMIPAFLSCGVSRNDAYDYGLYGCNDPNIPGREGGLRQVWFNLLRPFELALNEGEYPMEPAGEAGRSRESQFSLEDRMIGLMMGPYYGASTPPVAHMRGIEDLLDAYRAQVRFLLRDYRRAIENDTARERKVNAGRLRIEDCFLRGTIENATTWNDGGTPYHKIDVHGSGIGSVIDAFAAVEQAVFREKAMSLPQLADLMRKNWNGNERLQVRMSRGMPKFGNDIPWVDEMGRKIVDVFCDEVAAANSPEEAGSPGYLYTFFPCVKSDRDFTVMGKGVGATPDGRRAGHPLSENCSPTEGADTNGLTALLNSVARLPWKRVTGGPLNVRLHPSSVAGESGLAVLDAALRTYFDAGAMSIMLNVVGREELLDAQAHPERYKSLCVRVTGYAAYFVQMGKKAQEEIIRRTEIAR